MLPWWPTTSWKVKVIYILKFQSKHICLPNTVSKLGHRLRHRPSIETVFCKFKAHFSFKFIILCYYFSSFETGIANAITSFKWRKILLLRKNKHLPNRIIVWLTTADYFINFIVILSGLRPPWKHINLDTGSASLLYVCKHILDQ